MKSFLQELAEKVLASTSKLEDETIIFPNRRAALYFRKHLSDLLDRPVFPPRLFTIEEFFAQFSNLKVPDKLDLVFKLYHVYNEIVRTHAKEETIESFDHFYFWGEMLLKDFDEVDKYLVDANHLFKDLSHQKELDSNFDFLTEEQQEFLKSFWSNFEENQSANKKRFLQVWRQLPLVYQAFKTKLTSEQIAFEGMLQREVAENIREKSTSQSIGRIHFVGFNALTACEEKVISYFVEHHAAQVHWDLDAYYSNNIRQEAGRFFREYQQHKTLKGTFPENVPSHFKTPERLQRPIQLFGAPQPMAQVKLMAQVLAEQKLKGLQPEETLIVLPDEKLLMPVLHSISANVEKLNVTMGFPLASSTLFNLVELLIELQVMQKHEHFNHRQVLAILGHPYVVAADPASANNKRKEILKHNWVQIPSGYLASELSMHRQIFVPFYRDPSMSATKQIVHYLRNIVHEVGITRGLSDVDREYAFHFIKLLNRMEETLYSDAVTHQDAPTSKELQSSLKSFLRLLRQLVRSNKLPFTGEPLKGTQVMGVLETRNLDFRNVFVLSLNEGAFPSSTAKGSYIPYNIRKAYSLPTTEHQDAIYAYLFYRSLQRAENIFLFYNSETDVLGQGEMSRYLQQLIFESGIPIEKKILHNPIQPMDIHSIVVDKTERVMESLFRINEGNSMFKGISPSTLNTYVECRLKFYLRHVAKIKEPNEVEEELDARVLGNFLHDVMEQFYKLIIAQKKSNVIDSEDFNHYEPLLSKLIDDVFIKAYRLDPDKPVTYEGQRLVVREIVKRFADRIIEMDRQYAPFTLKGLEQGGMTFTIPLQHAPHHAIISGKIDRVDEKEGVLRVIDYKTGKDKLDFDNIASLFSRKSTRNKAAFQTLIYALLYAKNQRANGTATRRRLVPGLINRLNLFDDSFSFGLKMGREIIQDVEPLLPEFEVLLQSLLEEMFDPAIPFDQTTDTENCKLCSYRQLCYR